MKAGNLPVDKAGMDMVRDMALTFGSSQSLARLTEDFASLLTPEAKAPLRALTVALFQNALAREDQREAENPNKTKCYDSGDIFRLPHNDPKQAAQFASALAVLISWYEAETPATGAPPSFGLATLYEATTM